MITGCVRRLLSYSTCSARPKMYRSKARDVSNVVRSFSSRGTSRPISKYDAERRALMRRIRGSFGLSSRSSSTGSMSMIFLNLPDCSYW